MKKLFVFDLDFTLWNAGNTWCDHLTPPFSKQHSKVVDANGNVVRLYPDVREILKYLDKKMATLAVASRTFEPSWAKRLMHLLDIRKHFHHEEIYPSSKTQHFNALKKSTGLKFSEMIFFDDEHRNIKDVERLGVLAIYVPNGLGWKELPHKVLSHFGRGFRRGKINQRSSRESFPRRYDEKVLCPQKTGDSNPIYHQHMKDCLNRITLNQIVSSC
jgi:magnesium-dependent phosphatase 1